MRLFILVILAGAIVFTVYNSLTKEKNKVLQVGDAAPDFELVDMNGETHNLSEYKGQGVFWIFGEHGANHVKENFQSSTNITKNIKMKAFKY